MMSAMTDNKKSWWRRQMEQVYRDNAAKAIRKGKPLKVYSKKELMFYLENGWEILSHIPSSYGAPDTYFLTPARTHHV